MRSRSCPAGTILHNISGTTTRRPIRARLDPKNWVGDGQRTIDEMGFFWIGWVELTEEEYKTQLAERRERSAAAASTRGQQQQQQSQGDP